MSEEKPTAMSEFELGSSDVQYSTHPLSPVDGISRYPIYTDILSSIGTILRYFWLVIPITLLGTALVYYFLDQQPRIYESTATVVIYPQINPGDEDAILRVVDTMGYNVVGTYVQLLRSQTITSDAFDTVAADYSEDILDDAVIEISAIDNSSIVVITTRTYDPQASKDLADNIIQRTMRSNALLGPLSEFYPLQILDEGSLPKDPVAPNSTLGLLIGFVASAGLAIAVAFMVDVYRQASSADGIIVTSRSK